MLPTFLNIGRLILIGEVCIVALGFLCEIFGQFNELAVLAILGKPQFVNMDIFRSDLLFFDKIGDVRLILANDKLLGRIGIKRNIFKTQLR